MFDIKLNIEKILKEGLTESNMLDYKSIEYEDSKLSDFFKDTISFLNSEESYGKDKYIIFGVTDKGRLIGLKKDMKDDNEYQNLVKKIRPRPEISSGQIILKEKKIGFIFIPGKNDKNLERPYEMNDNYPSSGKKYVIEGQGFIRKGTTNCSITDSEREQMHQKKFLSKKIENIDFLKETNRIKQSSKLPEITQEFIVSASSTWAYSLNPWLIKMKRDEETIEQHNKNQVELFDELNRLITSYGSKISIYIFNDFHSKLQKVLMAPAGELKEKTPMFYSLPLLMSIVKYDVTGVIINPRQMYNLSMPDFYRFKIPIMEDLIIKNNELVEEYKLSDEFIWKN